MPTISGRTPFTGAGTVANVLQGSQYELMPFDGTIEIGLTSTVVATTCSIYSGPDVLAEPLSFVPYYSTEQAPRYPDDYHWEDEAAAGDRLKINLVAPGACVVNWAIRITPA